MTTDSEHPEDEQAQQPPEAAAGQAPTEEAAADEVPAETAEEPVETPAAPEPPAQTPEEPDAPATPVAEEAAPGQEPAAAEAQEPVSPPAAAQAEEPAAASAADAPAEEPAAAPVADAPAAEPAAAPAGDAEPEDVELPPRQRPEIPGADLVPDLIAEGDEFMDAEARAAAEAEAEAEAARAQEQDSEQEDSRPIADAAIDLAAGARYTATGKRKTAVARVILKPGSGSYVINGGKELDVFFPRDTLQRIIRQPLEAVGYEARMDVVARMHGGGVAAQAGALRHGIARALLEADPNLRGELKRRGFLTRDPRVKERKKAGLKKARKRPQFSKR